MFTVRKLERRARALHQLTSLTPELLRPVLEVFEPLWREAERERLARADCHRVVGAGNNGKLMVPERVLLAVVHLRQGFTLEFLETVVRPGQEQRLARPRPDAPGARPGRATRIRGGFARPDSRALQSLQDEPPKSGNGGAGGRSASVPRRKKIGTLEGLLEQFPELEDLVVDSTEQERGQPKPAKKSPDGKRPPGRPVNKRKFCSPKAGAHTLKVQLAVTPDGLIVHQGATAPGRMHDALVLERSRLPWALPAGVRLFGDKGYTGVEKV